MIRGILTLAACASLGMAFQPSTSAQPDPGAALLAAPAKSTGDAAADERFAKRLEVADAAMAKVLDLRADFEQRRHTPLLKKPIVSSGVVLSKGDRVRWDTVAPRASSMLIGAGEIRMYYPADKLVEVYPVGEGFKDLAGSPLPRLSVLKTRFDISPLAPRDLGVNDADPKFLAVLLTPKLDELRKHVASVKVLIDESRPAATKVVMTDPEGEETEILFTNVRLNAGVKADELELKLPEGVRIFRPLGEGNGAKEAPATSL